MHEWICRCVEGRTRFCSGIGVNSRSGKSGCLISKDRGWKGAGNFVDSRGGGDGSRLSGMPKAEHLCVADNCLSYDVLFAMRTAHILLPKEWEGLEAEELRKAVCAYVA